MMQPQELRVGNILKSHLTGELVVTDWLVIKHVCDGNLQSVYDNRPVYEPIPLTEELLVKAGFEIHDNSNEYWTLFVLPNGWHISLSHHTEPSAGVEKGGFYWGDEYRNYKYLHQLQNLYWCLAGKELDIKL